MPFFHFLVTTAFFFFLFFAFFSCVGGKSANQSCANGSNRLFSEPHTKHKIVCKDSITLHGHVIGSRSLYADHMVLLCTLWLGAYKDVCKFIFIALWKHYGNIMETLSKYTVKVLVSFPYYTDHTIGIVRSAWLNGRCSVLWFILVNLGS